MEDNNIMGVFLVLLAKHLYLLLYLNPTMIDDMPMSLILITQKKIVISFLSHLMSNIKKT